MHVDNFSKVLITWQMSSVSQSHGTDCVWLSQLHSSCGGEVGLVEDDVYAEYTEHIIHAVLDKQADS